MPFNRCVKCNLSTTTPASGSTRLCSRLCPAVRLSFGWSSSTVTSSAHSEVLLVVPLAIRIDAPVLDIFHNHRITNLFISFRTINISISGSIFEEGSRCFSLARYTKTDFLLRQARVVEPALVFRGAGLDSAALLRLLSSFGVVFKWVLSRFLCSVFAARLPCEAR